MIYQRSLRILLADNLPAFLQTRAEFLQKAGYDVLPAETPEKVSMILETRHVHLAILDLRMRDNDDEADISGLTIARDPRFVHIPKIILTNYPDYQRVREAMGPLQGASLPPAVDFLAKQEGAKAMITAVQHAIERYVALNQSLDFQWDSYLSFAQLLERLEWPYPPPPLDESILMAEDLFRRLFNAYEQVTFGHILARSATRILIALSAFDAHGRENQFIVAFGLVDPIADEIHRYTQDVPEQAKRFLTHKQTVFSVHFGAAAYAFNGGELEAVKSLHQLFTLRHWTKISQALTHLYQAHIPLWHDRGRAVNPTLSLDQYLEKMLLRQINSETLFQQIDAVCEQALSTNLAVLTTSPAKINFSGGVEQYEWPHPASFLARLGELALSPVQWGGTHGQVTLANVLVNQADETSLINFAWVGQSPLLVDYVMLELSILAEATHLLDVEALHQLEMLLLEADALATEFDTAPLVDEAKTVAKLLQQIRQETAVSAGCDLTTYEAARFALAMHKLSQFDLQQRHRRPTLRPYIGVLFTTTMTAAKLWQQDIAETKPPFWIDTVNKQVWVYGRQIELTIQEYQIVAYLHEHAGQICARGDIVENAIGEAYDDTFKQDDGRLNNAVNRLRKKIELNPSEPQFIMTARGRGYWLKLPTDS